MNSLNKALEIAIKAHTNQFDKAGEPYILHPLHLMMQCKDNTHRIVAVLHDVIEDSDVTLESLKYIFTNEIIFAVDVLTHRKDVPYFDYINEVKKNPIATKIKILDLQHNSELNRLKVVTDKDRDRVKKYNKAYCMLCDIDEIIF